ncbi:DUF2750 domain-containing protein [Thalassotalea sp. Y01]|uniref:DUF2750 domain-containing protein n=1 Tax=Thalassotalea sp. Y01 TaxID=2729613 RepID=UPI00145CDA29|nr:DUF2750 domain-containing protein [Thalassotalea sp. Y01]NMP15063.1 DUF2750 domain-containing protein [Thalassotalea sp. Y01]
MTEQDLDTYLDTINEEQRLYALTTSEGDWVVCDSDQDFNDVMPLWADAEQAKSFCVEQWQDYQVGEISLEQFLEEWVGDLNEDNVGIGINWRLDQVGLELNAIDFAKLLVKAL